MGEVDIMQKCLKFSGKAFRIDMLDRLRNSCLSLQSAPKSLLMLGDLKLLKEKYQNLHDSIVNRIFMDTHQILKEF